MGCMVKLTLSRFNRKAMLEDEDALKTLCLNGSREAPDEVRCRTYIALANLAQQLRGSEDSEVAQQIIKALSLGTNPKEPDGVRSRVFGALWSMSASAANLKEMWKNLDIRYAVQKASSLEE